MSNLEQVIREATSKRHPAVPAGELREIKQACRLSPENVSLAFQLLLTRLREPNLQVRLNVLNICAELMERSGTFRTIMADGVQEVLELCIGYSAGKPPSPAPAGVASELVSRALELLFQWTTKYARKHVQLLLSYMYLKNKLKLPLQDLPVQPAASASPPSQLSPAALRHQSENWDEIVYSAKSTVHELTSHLAALSAACGLDAPGEDDAGQDWEDVDEAGPSSAVATEGTSTFKTAWPRFDPGRVDLAIAGPLLDQAAAARQLVVQELVPVLRAELARGGAHGAEAAPLLCGLEEALRQLDLPGIAALAERWRALKGAAAEAGTERAEGSPPTGSRAALGAAPGDKEAAGRGQAPTTKGLGGRMPRVPPSQLPDADPYAGIVDPAAPRPGPHSIAKAVVEPAAVAARAPSAKQSSLPEEVRRRLAEQAPTLPTGLHTQFWDSSQAVSLTSGTAEVYNHWGAVDVAKELPTERLDAVFMLPAELLERQAKREVKEAVSPVLPARSAAGVHGERRAAKSTVSTLWSPSDMTRKEEQAYNAAVLGSSDELLARQLEGTESGSGLRKRGSAAAGLQASHLRPKAKSSAHRPPK
ncbi:hypothetical protein ACKKBG_A18295 [Auxenochlorella protothecoides x Auxenochlorella symbiontica]